MASQQLTVDHDQVCKVCKHKNLIYIGKQQVDKLGREYLALFNCNFCHSTISIRMKAKSGRKKSRSLQ
jgi:hypothetical protein